MVKTLANCLRCGASISELRLRRHAKYCSKRCRVRSEPVSLMTHTSTTTRGAVAELIVASDLMKRGYHVFRALSANCVCDLVAIKENNIIRVEVKSDWGPLPGRLVPKSSIKFDVFAIVHNNVVSYIPEYLV